MLLLVTSGVILIAKDITNGTYNLGTKEKNPLPN